MKVAGVLDGIVADFALDNKFVRDISLGDLVPKDSDCGGCDVDRSRDVLEGTLSSPGGSGHVREGSNGELFRSKASFNAIECVMLDWWVSTWNDGKGS